MAIYSTPDVRLSNRKFCWGEEGNNLFSLNIGIAWGGFAAFFFLLFLVEEKKKN